MKHIFHRSFVLIAFISAINFVLTIGTSLFLGSEIGSKMDTNDSVTIFVFTVLVTLLLFLNITDIVNFWLVGKSQEIKTKHIVGIPRTKIYLHIYANLNLLVLISFIIGTVLSFGVHGIISSFLEMRIGLLPVTLSFMSSIVVINGFSIVLLKHRLRRGL